MAKKQSLCNMRRYGMFFATDEHGLFSPAALHKCFLIIQVSHSLNFLEFRSSGVTGVQTIVLKALFALVYRG